MEQKNHIMGQKNHILVTGVSGSGKSTYARELSKKTGLPIVALDEFDTSWKEEDYTKGARKGVLRALKEINAPSIIEGQGIMRMKIPEISDLPLHIVRPSDEVIIQRRMERSYKKHGKDLDKEKYEAKAKWLIDQDRDNLERLIKGHPNLLLIS